MPRLLRRVAVLGLALAVSAGALAECVSTDVTPEQQACCVAMHHDCGATRMQLSCCPNEPQPLEPAHLTTVKPESMVPVLLSGPLALLPEPGVRLGAVLAASLDREVLNLPERPAYLLLSVFLI